MFGYNTRMNQALHQNHLFVIEDEQGRRDYVLNAPIYSIGRHPQCDIPLVSTFISRRHATLVQFPNEDGSFYYRIIDGNLKGKTSANGIVVNGHKRQNHDLKNADEIVFGPQIRATYYCMLDESSENNPLNENDTTFASPIMESAQAATTKENMDDKC